MINPNDPNGPNGQQERSYDVVDTSSYRTRLISFINIHLSEEGCRLVYNILSFLFENGV